MMSSFRVARQLTLRRPPSVSSCSPSSSLLHALDNYNDGGCGVSTTTASTIPRRSYISRAHPVPTPTFPVDEAVRMVLEGIQERVVKRQAHWDRNREKRTQRGENVDTDFDESVELVVNLNLDPRKPGQSLRGNVALPHGNGKKVRVMVFTSDETVAKEALEAGAAHAGGEELVEQIVKGEGDVNLQNLDRAVADQAIMPHVTSKLARVLGPRGLMPNTKVGTLVSLAEEIPQALEKQLDGEVLFRTDQGGIVHLGVGKGSFDYFQIMENIQTAMETLQDLKPEKYGRGVKKPTANARYILRVHVTATQQKGSYRLNLPTINPVNSSFMGSFKMEVAAKKREEAKAAAA